MLFTLMALILTLILSMIITPAFNSFTGKELKINYLDNPIIVISMIFLLVFVGVTSGSYPAFFISRFQPVAALKGTGDTGSRSSLLRKGLVILQFSISIILIISTIVVMDQLDFLQNRKLGFKKEHVVVVPGGVVAGDSIELVTDEGTQTLTLRMIYTDHDYLKTMGMEIVKGRDFSKEMSTDTSQAFIINEAAVRKLQLENPLETRFEWGGTKDNPEKKGSVIGVVKDFQFQSLKNEINPLVIQIRPSNTRIFAMRIQPVNIPETLKFIENKWKKLDPAHPFEFTFMDEIFNKLYRSEAKQSKIFNLFSIVAIFIAALGLFGLALFTVKQRSKEIGIRKVLGAPAGKIFILVSKDFARLVLISNLFAWPIAYFVMNKWLQNFAYRVSIKLWIFVLSAAIAYGIALFTVSFQAIKAAIADPIDPLRYE